MKIFLLFGVALTLAGCTVHPPGESTERAAAARAGEPFTQPPEKRTVPPLPDDPTADQLVDYALQTNADLEAKYWEWRSAIEQIPQDGTQATNLALSANVSISRGKTGLGETVLSAGNDPMADIVLPPKLSAAARRALENARAAGLRFREAQFELRAKVLDAWYDYALTTELIGLEQANAQLLRTTMMVVDARNRVGAAGQQDVLKARNQLDLSENDLASLRAQLPAQRAKLNALLNRDPRASLPAARDLPNPPAFPYTDDQVIAWAAQHNPDLAAQARERAAKEDVLSLARLQYLPDLSLSAGTDLQGLAQSLMAMVTVPVLRHEAIDAAVSQAEANLRATEAMRRQTRIDLAAKLLSDVATLHDAERQLELLEKLIVPRAEQAVTLARSAYESGQTGLLDLLDSQRSLIALRRLMAGIRINRLKRLADVEAITTRRLGAGSR